VGKVGTPREGISVKQYRYLIIGGGMTGHAALKSIREVDAQGSLAVIGAETHPPYNRPPLTKALWQGKPLDTIWRKMDPGSAELHLGRRIRSIDPSRKEATDDQGETYGFEKLLVATGGTPRHLPAAEGVLYYRTLDDYQALRGLTGKGLHFGIIGGGFIGTELAAALAQNQERVSLIFPEGDVGERVFPGGLAHVLTETYRQKGVEVMERCSLVKVESRGQRRALKLRRSDGGESEVVVDAVVAGLGITPNTELAAAAGLPVDGGIVTDQHLRAGHPDIYAAGDVASFYNPALDKRIRVEHEDNAVTMGARAGRNMAGETEPYDHLPFFYSDLFEYGYEAVGELDSRLEIVEEWSEPFRKGVLYYMREGRVRGVLLWNVWGQLGAARSLVAGPGPFQTADLRGRIPQG
jgi:NADPH-dependent 2,4-dienoyl-CoA reductase/sulfur reductase-like enzyme